MTKQPTLVIVSDWIRRDLHEPLRHFKSFEIVHLYRQAGYQDMKDEDFKNPKATQWHSMMDLWQKIAAARPAILQGGEPWANRSSLLITFVSWWYKKTHPRVKLIWPSMENRPIAEKFSWLESKLLSFWTKIYGQSSDLVMYLNGGARKNLLETGLPEAKLKRVMWATWGVDCGEFSPQSKSKVKTQKSKFDFDKEKIILFVGKVSEAKGVPYLLEAFEELKKQVSDVKLVLAGPQDKNSKFKIQNSNYIEYLGIVKNKELPNLFRQASVVIAPSITTKIWEEQVGMVNLQAMACGVPVITTRSGAIPEFVQDGQGAMLVPEKDSQAIADRLVKFFKNSKLQVSMSQKGRKFVQDHYEVKKNIAIVEKVLQQILAKE